MTGVPVVPNVARVMRIIHAALLAGCTGAGIVLSIVRVKVPLPPFTGAPILGYAMSGVALLILAVAALGVRPRVPERRPDQTAEAFWSVPATRLTLIFLWAGVEGAGIIGWVGYFVTGSLAGAVTGVIALLTLYAFRPARIEGDQAS
jgi:hypothetical protein